LKTEAFDKQACRKAAGMRLAMNSKPEFLWTAI
jgi:hypothetical protein